MGSLANIAPLDCQPAFVWRELEKTVRVDDTVRKCTVFVGAERGGNFIPYGTGFIVGVDYGDSQFPFLVTAEHVLDDIVGDDFAIRVNRHNGKAESVPQTKRKIFYAKDKKSDVVLVNIDLSSTIYDYLAIQLDRKYWQGKRDEIMAPTIGDEIAIAGLYTSHYGQLKNIPVIRIGHIAAMPEEPVYSHRGYVDGYLVELNSIAGLSGSPVYLNIPPVRVVNEKLEFMTSPLALLPLGILTGYHVTENKDDQFVVPKFQPLEGEIAPSEEESKEERRTGFGVVIPFEVLLDWAESKSMQHLFKVSAELKHANSGARPASAGSSPTNTEAPSGKEAFNSLLDAAARTQKKVD